jgi:hypothetical protein
MPTWRCAPPRPPAATASGTSAPTCLPTGKCSGVEALVRWQHPERGLLPPSDVVAMAEQHDLIVPLTRWVLATAARQRAAWDAAGLPLVGGVDISAHHFTAGTLVRDVLDALATAGLPPERLVLELTETSVARDPELAAAQCAQLRIAGVEVSTGASSSGPEGAPAGRPRRSPPSSAWGGRPACASWPRAWGPRSSSRRPPGRAAPSRRATPSPGPCRPTSSPPGRWTARRGGHPLPLLTDAAMTAARARSRTQLV